MNAKLVDITKEPMDETNYGYAICECAMIPYEAVRVDRPEYSGYVYFDCPRCGKSLGLFLSGKSYRRE